MKPFIQATIHRSKKYGLTFKNGKSEFLPIPNLTFKFHRDAFIDSYVYKDILDNYILSALWQQFEEQQNCYM